MADTSNEHSESDTLTSDKHHPASPISLLAHASLPLPDPPGHTYIPVIHSPLLHQHKPNPNIHTSKAHNATETAQTDKYTTKPHTDTNATKAGCDESHDNDEERAGSNFRLMTYNLLAQCLCRRELYPYCERGDLRIKNRLPRLIATLRSIAPDIACLSEVDNLDLLLPSFPDYDSFYTLKPGVPVELSRKSQSEKKTNNSCDNKDDLQAGTTEESGNAGGASEKKEKEGHHGLLVLWKRDRFELVKREEIVYDAWRERYTPSQPQPDDIHDQNTDFNVGLEYTGNIAQIVALKPVDTSSHGGEDSKMGRGGMVGGVVVTNTHLHWRPTFHFERLRQVGILLERLKVFSGELVQTGDQHVDGVGVEWKTFLCGDWNMNPASPVYKLLTRTVSPSTRHPPNGDDHPANDTHPDTKTTTACDDDVLTPEDLTSLLPKTDSPPASTPPDPHNQQNERKAPPTPLEHHDQENDRKAKEEVRRWVATIKRFPVLQSLYGTYCENFSSACKSGCERASDADEGEGGEREGVKNGPQKGEPPYTVYSSWKGCLDYIFYMDDRVTTTGAGGGEGLSDCGDYKQQSDGHRQTFVDVVVESLLRIPAPETLEPGIPNRVHGSDHVPLAVNLSLTVSP
ncbi:Endonuclease/exonuclease/phosphatase [Gaertneriomyces semiglobifer]|nr:Endonuclease/exonuclease/phosphatase [Gaertneriomyces semiglobifer]